jgi:hypothetical protein
LTFKEAPMTKPEFRIRITDRMNQQPAPIPQAWKLVDEFHGLIDRTIDGAQQMHARLAGSSAARFDRVYRTLHTIHWYV